MLVSEAFDLYRRAEVVAGGLSRKTFESYIYSEKLAMGFFGDVPISKIQAMDVRDYYDHLLTWQKPDTARGNIICIRSVLRYCKRKGEDVMDIEDIKIPKRQKREIHYLTPPEIDEFIDVVATPTRGYAEINRLRNVAIVELLWATGLRVGELCKLNRNSIRNRQFTMVGKSKAPRVCFINDRAEAALKAYLAKRTDKCEALFVANQTERRITTGGVQRIFKCACDKSDFDDVHPHTIRHSFATFMLERNVDLRYIADLLGHESLDTTKIYTHYANPKLRMVYENAMLGLRR